MVFGTGNLLRLIQIYRYKFSQGESRQLHDNEQPLVFATLVYLMPLNFTFMFLFYTETLALFVVLSLYQRTLCSTGSSSLVNLVFALASLTVRQTNIIWINYLPLVFVIANHP